jgi:hypothetical protein
VLPKRNEQLTAYFIKFYHVISAGGLMAPPIFICEDKNMEAEAISAHEIRGLGVGVQSTKIGPSVNCSIANYCLNESRVRITAKFSVSDDNQMMLTFGKLKRQRGWIVLGE